MTCRESFVAMIKDENFYSHGTPWSLKAHWAGKGQGFADQMLQRRYRDYQRGWADAEKNETAIAGKDGA